LTASAALALPVALLLGSAASAQPPDAAGWWSFASQPGQDAPPPPDVEEGDLLVQGGDLGGSAPDLGLPTSPSAVAALRFSVPQGATVGPLTLDLGSGGRATDIRAYPVKKDDWKPSNGGPLSEAPQANGSRYSVGVPNDDGTQLVFRDIGRLVPEEGRLSFVLMPGATDRVVVKKPGAAALQVSEAGGSGSGPSAPVTGPAYVPPGSTGSTGSGESTGLPPISSGSSDAVPQLPDAVPPAVAGAAPSQAAAPAVAPAAATAAGDDEDDKRIAADQRTRYLVAMEALLVLATFGLLGWGPLSRLGAALGTGAPTEPSTRRGVGRFVSERSGEVVRL
jgi:hypothetical protein